MTENSEVIECGDLVTEKLKLLNLSILGSIKSREDRLERHYLDQKAALNVELAFCDSCGRWSLSTLESCPFCGDAAPPVPFPDGGDVVTSPSKMKYSKYTVAHLDQAVSSIRSSSRIAQEEVYKIGKTLELIKEEQLWRFRIKDDGKLAYKDFYEFARKEIGISKSYTARLIRVCQSYIPSDIKRFGVTKLDVSLRLPEKRREEFLTNAERMKARGPEITDLAERISAEDKNLTVPEIRVPVYIPLGIKMIPMWKRATNSKNYRMGAPTEPARVITENPWCKVWLSKDVAMFIKIGLGASGELQLIMDIRKGTERPEIYKK